MRFQGLHALEQSLQFPQQVPFEGAAPVGVWRHGLHLLERPLPTPLVDGLTQAGRAAEVAMSQQLNLSHTQLVPRHGLHEPGDVPPMHAVHAHERSQRHHVRIDRQGTAEEDLLHAGADFGEQVAPGADPGLAARQHPRHIAGIQAVGRE